ncbi:MAG TPA: DUF2891 domain-containing protein [Caulobacteraceae bacterium]
MPHRLTPETAERFARIALGHVEREYPNKLDHVLNGPGDAQGPRALHPIFYGSFDWHSCVHGHWLLARLLALHPDGPAAPDIRALLDRQLTHEKVAVERAYLDRPMNSGFERPYGAAWILMLQAELERSAASRPWAEALRPLAEAFAARLKAYLPKLTYPIRAGTHANSAFALRLADDYAEVCGDAELAGLIAARARSWFGADADCQAWEPSGDDFLSSALMEAELMRRVLPPADFAEWFGGFLPRLERLQPASLFRPAVVSDPSDGKIAHLDGVNLSRAWCMRGIAGALGADDPRRSALLDAAEAHLDASLHAVAGDYMGEHWLASFALLALEA